MNTERPWRYSSAIAVDESKCVPANPEKQHYTVVPASAYCSMKLRCERCDGEFWFSANEQRVWYEEWRFWIDSCPKECQACRRELRRLKSLRQEYDREIARALLTCTELDFKIRIASVIDQRREAGEDLPAKAHENQEVLSKQITRLSGPSAA